MPGGRVGAKEEVTVVASITTEHRQDRVQRKDSRKSARHKSVGGGGFVSHVLTCHQADGFRKKAWFLTRPTPEESAGADQRPNAEDQTSAGALGRGLNIGHAR